MPTLLLSLHVCLHISLFPCKTTADSPSTKGYLSREHVALPSTFIQKMIRSKFSILICCNLYLFKIAKKHGNLWLGLILGESLERFKVFVRHSTLLFLSLLLRADFRAAVSSLPATPYPPGASPTQRTLLPFSFR